MHHVTFLQDLAIVMIASGIVTVLFLRMKQPVVLGYILAGVIIGPHTPPFSLIADEAAINTLSELGVVFLLFSLGLEFSLRKLKAVGASALIAATLEILLMVWVGYHIGQLFGWNTMDSVFLGAILSISSTTIIIKALEELGKTKESFARIIFGVLIVEDILAIVMIALLSGFATTGSLAIADIGSTVLRLSSFLGILLVVGLIAVPRLFNYVARFKSNEMLLITTVGLCLGVSLLAVKLGYSVALGAFLIGAIIAEARQIAKIEALTHPIRDLFSAVFFVSIGLLIDPSLIVKYWLPILVISAAVVVGKVLTCSIGIFITGHDLRSSMRVGMGLAQIGEFSFIIAALGLTLNVTSDFLYPIAVAVSAVTTLLTPYLLKSSDVLVAWFDRVAPRPAIRFLETYTRWVNEFQKSKATNHGGRLLRRIGWQVGLNLLLIAAVFIGAAFLRSHAVAWLPMLPGGDNSVRAVVWLGAMIVSLPMLIAVFRKLQAAGMLVSEMSVTEAAAGNNTGTLRAVVSATVFGASAAALALFVTMLSSAILPSWNVLLVLTLVLIAAVLLMRNSFTRIYAKAQIALQETFSTPALEPHEAHPEALPPALSGAEVSQVLIESQSPAARWLIGELRLRTQTGASIVSIQRGSENLINPGVDEEIQPGDRLVLLGSPHQLDAARAFLNGTNKT